MTFPSISEEDLAIQVALGANQGNQKIENGGEIKLLGDSRDVQMEPYTIPAGGVGGAVPQNFHLQSELPDRKPPSRCHVHSYTRGIGLPHGTR